MYVVRLAGPGALHDGLGPVPLAGRLARPLQGRLDTPLTRVCASGATNVMPDVFGVPTSPIDFCQIRMAHSAHYTPSARLPSPRGTEKSGTFVLDKCKECRLLQWSPRAVRNKKLPQDQNFGRTIDVRAIHEMSMIDHRLRAFHRVERHPLTAT